MKGLRVTKIVNKIICEGVWDELEVKKNVSRGNLSDLVYVKL